MLKSGFTWSQAQYKSQRWYNYQKWLNSGLYEKKTQKVISRPTLYYYAHKWSTEFNFRPWEVQGQGASRFWVSWGPSSWFIDICLLSVFRCLGWEGPSSLVSSYRNNPFMRTLLSWPHLSLTTTKRLYLLYHHIGCKGFTIWILGWHKLSVHTW